MMNDDCEQGEDVSSEKLAVRIASREVNEVWWVVAGGTGWNQARLTELVDVRLDYCHSLPQPAGRRRVPAFNADRYMTHGRQPLTTALIGSPCRASSLARGGARCQGRERS